MALPPSRESVSSVHKLAARDAGSADKRISALVNACSDLEAHLDARAIDLQACPAAAKRDKE